MFRTMRRKVPWIVVFEAAMMMRNRWTASCRPTTAAGSPSSPAGRRATR